MVVMLGPEEGGSCLCCGPVSLKDNSNIIRAPCVFARSPQVRVADVYTTAPANHLGLSRPRGGPKTAPDIHRHSVDGRERESNLAIRPPGSERAESATRHPLRVSRARVRVTRTHPGAVRASRGVGGGCI
ncbi:unnamed protein product [Lampetra fluviatilis]